MWAVCRPSSLSVSSARANGTKRKINVRTQCDRVVGGKGKKRTKQFMGWKIWKMDRNQPNDHYQHNAAIISEIFLCFGRKVHTVRANTAIINGNSFRLLSPTPHTPIIVFFPRHCAHTQTHTHATENGKVCASVYACVCVWGCTLQIIIMGSPNKSLWKMLPCPLWITVYCCTAER